MTTATLAAVGTAAAILAAVLLLFASLKAGADAETRHTEAAADRSAIRGDLRDELGNVRTDLQDGLAAANTDREAIRTELRDGLAAANTDREAIRTELRDGFAAVLSRLPAEPAADEGETAAAPAGPADRPAEPFPVAAKRRQP